MAENIGKVIVSIEAKVEALEAGLAKAEATMKASADRLAAQNDKLSSRFTKSWVEFSSKLSVITTAARIAKQAWDLVDDVLKVVTNETLNASNKILGVMNSIEKSSIPVVSQFMSIGHGIHGWITGERKLRREVAAREAIAMRAAKANKERQKLRQSTSAIMSKTLEQLQHQATIEGAITQTGKTRLKNEKAYGDLKSALDRRIAKLEGKATRDAINNEKRKRDEILRLVREQHDTAMRAAGEIDKINRTAHKERMREIVEERRAKEQAVQDAIATEQIAANKIATAKMDLLTRIAILEAEARGDTEKAQLIALDARIKKEKEAAIVLGKKTGAPSAKAEEAEKEKVRDSGSQVRSSLFESELQKIADQYDQKIKDLARQLIALGATEGQSAETKAKRAELSARHVAMIQEKLAKELSLVTEGVDPAVIAAEIAKVEAKYKSLRAERSKATKEQLALIDKVAELETARLKERYAGRGQTTTVSTAIGSFTVAMGQDKPLQKEQTTLLTKIAESNLIIADAMTRQNAGVIVPAA